MIDAFLNAFKDAPSNKLSELFAISKKKEAVKLCKELVLDYLDVSTMIAGCGSLGYNYIPRFFDSNVDHIWEKAIKQERTADNFRKTFNQLAQESKRKCFHLFVSEESHSWHMLFWDTTEHAGDSRFIGGAHIHFVNHLWGLNLVEVVSALPDRPAKSAHIKTR